MERKNNDSRLTYWADRLRSDVDNVEENRKIEIFKALLRDYIDLTEKETEIFIFTSAPLTSVETLGEDELLYLSAERKVADFYAAEHNDKQDPSKQKKILKIFQKSPRRFLQRTRIG